MPSQNIWTLEELRRLKFLFSKKATKIDKIFTGNLTVCSVKSTVKILSIFVAFLEKTNFIILTTNRKFGEIL